MDNRTTDAAPAPSCAPGEVERLKAEVEKWRHKLWMVACHAMGGGMPDIEGIEQSTNDICVQISALRNKVYQAGKDAALSPQGLDARHPCGCEADPVDGLDYVCDRHLREGGSPLETQGLDAKEGQ